METFIEEDVLLSSIIRSDSFQAIWNKWEKDLIFLALKLVS